MLLAPSSPVTFVRACIAVGLADSMHFGILFGVVLAMYGTIGHFYFGSQAADWKTNGSSVLALFKASAEMVAHDARRLCSGE
jgi:hypothetical protein